MAALRSPGTDHGHVRPGGVHRAEVRLDGVLENPVHKDIDTPEKDSKIVLFATGRYQAMDTNAQEMHVDFAIIATIDQ